MNSSVLIIYYFCKKIIAGGKDSKARVGKDIAEFLFPVDYVAIKWLCFVLCSTQGNFFNRARSVGPGRFLLSLYSVCFI